MPDVANDRRLDPRLRAMLAAFPEMTPTDAASWEEIVENAAASEMGALISQMMDANDTEEIAPSAGLRVTEHEFTSSPDGNTIKLRFVRPDNDEVVPGIYYIHGGGMASMSAYDGNYRAWARIIAANGVAVTMVDFRNSVSPSSAPE
ncbi:MAG: hypothetical protein R8F63_21885, partial [Acidimicrobiales bacterium]|nr:hypothetical protein [Acidimicrobiales bacterium]